MTYRIKTGRYEGEEIKATFTQTFDIDPELGAEGAGDYDLVDLSICDVMMDINEMPQEALDAIYTLAELIGDWNND